MGENVFAMAGDTGDAVYAMCAMRALGGGHLVFWPRSYVRDPMSPKKVERIASFFASQSYVLTVQFNAGQAIPNYNLDDFRDLWARMRKAGNHKPYSICEFILMTYKLPLALAQERWLEIEPKHMADVVFSCTPRYRDSSFPWHKVYDKYVRVDKLSVVFLGTLEEANEFNREVGNVDWYPTDNLLDAARIIAGAKLLVSNQNALGAVASGLKIPWLQETWQAEKNCLFTNVISGTSDMELPDVK